MEWGASYRCYLLFKGGKIYLAHNFYRFQSIPSGVQVRVACSTGASLRRKRLWWQKPAKAAKAAGEGKACTSVYILFCQVCFKCFLNSWGALVCPLLGCKGTLLTPERGVFLTRVIDHTERFTRKAASLLRDCSALWLQPSAPALGDTPHGAAVSHTVVQRVCSSVFAYLRCQVEQWTKQTETSGWFAFDRRRAP